MSKLKYILAIFAMALSFNAFAQEDCPEGQVLDPDLGICVDAPVEAPSE